MVPASLASAAVVDLGCLAFVDENQMPMTRLLNAAADFSSRLVRKTPGR
jgi:hypothetical protein